MGLIEIIAVIIAIPIFFIAVIELILNSWIGGLLTGSILTAFGIHPLIVGLVSIIGILTLIVGIFKLAESFF